MYTSMSEAYSAMTNGSIRASWLEEPTPRTAMPIGRYTPIRRRIVKAESVAQPTARQAEPTLPNHIRVPDMVEEVFTGLRPPLGTAA